MFTMQHYNLSDINSSDSHLNKLYEIFKCTLDPDLREDEFWQYLTPCFPETLDLTYIVEDENVVGFCTASSYPIRFREKKILILRSAFGLDAAHRNGKFPLNQLFLKYIRCKIKNLFTPVYVAGFMANPLMYAMICNYTSSCYPRHNHKTPQHILELKEKIKSSMKITGEEVEPFVMKIHFQVHLDKNDITRIEASSNQHVKYYLNINPGYLRQLGVLVIVPVNFVNIICSMMRYFFRMIRKNPAFR